MCDIHFYLYLCYFKKQRSFKEQQLLHEHVKTAYAKFGAPLLTNLSKNQVTVSSLNVLLRVFKEEKIIELWIKNQSDSAFKHLKSFPILLLTGSLGPKRNNSDGQVPEGFYYIDKLVPESPFHLSEAMITPLTQMMCKSERYEGTS